MGRKRNQTTYHIAPKILNVFKSECSKEGRYMSAVLRELIVNWLRSRGVEIDG